MIKGYKLYNKKYFKPDLTVIGFIEMFDGLGRQSAEIISALSDKVKVRFVPTRNSLLDDVPRSVRNIAKKPPGKLGNVVIYEDCFYNTSSDFLKRKFSDTSQSSIKFAYTMFESTKIPKFWVDNLNTYFDAAIVPDKYYVTVYENSGVTIPIFCVPLGLNLKDFLTKPIKKKANSPFVFGCFSTCIERKNHVDLVRAFHNAFENSEDVTLYINCKSYSQKPFDALQKEIQAIGAKNITVTTKCFSKTEYLQEFTKLDCYVSLSKAEGFSIQPREAMALGLPVIVSDNTAQTTICDSGLALRVSCPSKEPAFYETLNEVHGERYNIDIKEASKAMKEIYSNYAFYNSLSEKRRLWASYYDYSQLKELYQTVVQPYQVVLSDENKVENGTIYTTSTLLKVKYDQLIKN